MECREAARNPGMRVRDFASLHPGYKFVFRVKKKVSVKKKVTIGGYAG
jgi:hypothetical protein